MALAWELAPSRPACVVVENQGWVPGRPHSELGSAARQPPGPRLKGRLPLTAPALTPHAHKPRAAAAAVVAGTPGAWGVWTRSAGTKRPVRGCRWRSHPWVCKTMQVTHKSRKSRATACPGACRGNPPSAVMSWGVAGMGHVWLRVYASTSFLSFLKERVPLGVAVTLTRVPKQEGYNGPHRPPSPPREERCSAIFSICPCIHCFWLYLKQIL